MRGLRFAPRPAALIAIYCTIALFTFGHACAHHVCGRGALAENICVGDTAFVGFSDALLWPLYWSWELQS